MVDSGVPGDRRRFATAARRLAFPVAVLTLAGATLACSGSGSDEGDGTTDTLAPVRTGEVTISAADNRFVPETVTVASGTVVTFVNDGRNQHNVLAVEATPFEVETASFEPGETYTWVAGEPGIYRYYCSVHGTATAGMTGTVQVVAG